jgi:hypothetical protein
MAIPQRRKVILQFRERRGAEIVATIDIIGADLLHGDLLAGHEFALGGLTGDFRQGFPGIRETFVAAAHLLPFPSLPISSNISRNLVSHSDFPSATVSDT